MQNEIKLLKNNQHRDDSDFEWINEFYEFLQGEIPQKLSFRKHNRVKLTPKKAFSVIYYLQEHFPVFPDTIEQCKKCQRLFDSNREGDTDKMLCQGCYENFEYLRN